MRPDAAMVFAAGFGTRMGALTRDTPKPLLMAGGLTLLDRALGAVSGAGIGRVVVNTHYLADQVAAHLKGRTGVTVVEERPEILETGGGLKAALPMLGAGPVLTVNPDTVFFGPNPVAQLLDGWDGGAGALMLLARRGDMALHRGPGDFFCDAHGVLARRGDAAEAPFVYAGVQITWTEALADIPDRAFSLNLLWDRMIAAGTLRGMVYSGRCVDVGTPEGLALADQELS